ncbi:KOW domain-containing RNA-binding protein [Clostridium niameyense]|uniref:KOW domain-containing RNA-binding protein n=1 Tax=Clostridium niameyense TaxID=1622073 RepID=UPI00067F68AE|nr:KOW domain-containing RNA-binding protein [Clostridium niameyense]
MSYKCQVGRLVYSKAGRDKDKCFIIVDVLDDKYVYISDGNMRTIENPKKKKIRHLVFTSILCNEMSEREELVTRINNSFIRKFIQSHQFNKEV